MEMAGHDGLRGGRPFMDGLALHYYTNVKRLPDGTRVGSATQFDEAEWIEIVAKGLFMDELVARHSTIMDKWDPKKKVSLVVDEWGTWFAVEPGTHPRFLYQQSTMRDAISLKVAATIASRMVFCWYRKRGCVPGSTAYHVPHSSTTIATRFSGSYLSIATEWRRTNSSISGPWK